MPELDHHPTKTQTDWDRLRRQTDEEIARAVEADPDAARIQTADDMKLFKPTPARTRS